MKKYLITSLLLITLIPSIAFASWWNPLSWFNNWKFNKIEKIQEKLQQEEKINELQKQIEELKTQEEYKTEAQKKPESTNLDINTPVIKPAIISQTTTDVCLNIEGIQSQIPAGYSSISNICTLLEVKDYCPNIIGVQSEIPEGKLFYRNTNECLTLEEIDEIIEEKSNISNEEPEKTTLNVEKITCSKQSTGKYLLPFSVKGEWVSGWVQVRISDGNEGVFKKGLDLDISNIDKGFIFGRTGSALDSVYGYGYPKEIKLEKGLKGTYKISIHSVVPSYNRGVRMYSQSSLIAEKSGEFILPDCE